MQFKKIAFHLIRIFLQYGSAASALAITLTMHPFSWLKALIIVFLLGLSTFIALRWETSPYEEESVEVE